MFAGFLALGALFAGSGFVLLGHESEMCFEQLPERLVGELRKEKKGARGVMRSSPSFAWELTGLELCDLLVQVSYAALVLQNRFQHHTIYEWIVGMVFQTVGDETVVHI